MVATLLKIDKRDPDPVPPEVDPVIVRELEQTLQEAREGKIKGVAMIVVRRDDCYLPMVFGADLSLTFTLGCLEVMKVETVLKMMRNDGA